MEAISYKYLNYWWIPDSEIDPSQANEDYFKVFYDDHDRYIIVERYDVDHHLKTHDRFFWDGSTLAKVEVYEPNGSMLKYIIYRYGRNGESTGRDHYSPEGELLLSEPADS